MIKAILAFLHIDTQNIEYTEHHISVVPFERLTSEIITSNLIQSFVFLDFLRYSGREIAFNTESKLWDLKILLANFLSSEMDIL